MNELSMVDETRIKLEIYDIVEKMTLTEQVELLNKIKGFSARRKKRSDVAIAVVFTVNGVDYRGVASNISFDGLFIMTNMVFNEGEEIKVKMADVNIKDDSMVKGTIVRVTEEGIGVRLLRR